MYLQKYLHVSVDVDMEYDKTNFYKSSTQIKETKLLPYDCLNLFGFSRGWGDNILIKGLKADTLSIVTLK